MSTTTPIPALVPGAAPASGPAARALPRHVAIIMDGNGRWAQERGMRRAAGHVEGARRVDDITRYAAGLGIEVLTLYSFSIENWKRPREETDFLMELCTNYLVEQRPTMMENNIRFALVGRRSGLPQSLLNELDATIEATSVNTGMTLALALNYGSRAEITDAVQAIARKVKAGVLDPEQITEQVISDHLYTVGLPDPDLLIRTAGEMRVSNYLLWQISYAELYVSKVCWPEFSTQELDAALKDFAGRKRKFGEVR